jgi:hypothetical protein
MNQRNQIVEIATAELGLIEGPKENQTQTILDFAETTNSSYLLSLFRSFLKC